MDPSLCTEVAETLHELWQDVLSQLDERGRQSLAYYVGIEAIRNVAEGSMLPGPAWTRQDAIGEVGRLCKKARRLLAE